MGQYTIYEILDIQGDRIIDKLVYSSDWSIVERNRDFISKSHVEIYEQMEAKLEKAFGTPLWKVLNE
jgi:hypothetical protein